MKIRFCQGFFTYFLQVFQRKCTQDKSQSETRRNKKQCGV